MSKQDLNGHGQVEMLGNISIISNDNPVHSPSLIQDVWEFEHDPDDQEIWEFIRLKDDKISKRHSYQEIVDNRLELQNNHHQLNAPKNYSQSEVSAQSKNQYGLKVIVDHQGGGKMTRCSGDKLINPKILPNLNCIQDRRGSKSPYQPRDQTDLIKCQIDKHKQQQQICYDLVANSRDVTILERKIMSNINYLIRQTKEMAFLSKFSLIQLERQETKKAVMKLQIQCRKLRISLRSSSASIIRIYPLRKNEFLVSPRNNDQTQQKPSNAEIEKQKVLSQQIIKEKKKFSELNTKTSLLSNYYNVIRGKKMETFANDQSDTCEDTFGYRQNRSPPHRKVSNWIAHPSQIKKYHELLLNKLLIIKGSLSEMKEETIQKQNRKQEENSLLRKQIEFINTQIEKTEEGLREYKEVNLKSGFFRRKYRPQAQIQGSKSKRKGIVGRDGEKHFHEGKEINRTRSQHLLCQKSKRKNFSKKQGKDIENNQYFLNVDSYRIQ